MWVSFAINKTKSPTFVISSSSLDHLICSGKEGTSLPERIKWSREELEITNVGDFVLLIAKETQPSTNNCEKYFKCLKDKMQKHAHF